MDWLQLCTDAWIVYHDPPVHRKRWLEKVIKATETTEAYNVCVFVCNWENNQNLWRPQHRLRFRTTSCILNLGTVGTHMHVRPPWVTEITTMNVLRRFIICAIIETYRFFGTWRSRSSHVLASDVEVRLKKWRDFWQEAVADYAKASRFTKTHMYTHAHTAVPLPQLTLKVCFRLPGRVTERKKRMFFFVLGKQSVVICRQMLLITPFYSFVPLRRAHHPLAHPHSRPDT